MAFLRLTLTACSVSLALGWPTVVDAGTEGDLINAAHSGNVDEVRTSLAKGADVNGKDSGGITALIMASGMGYGDVARVLLDAKADVNAKDHKGNTALTAASRNGDANVAALLRKAGAR